MVDATISDGDDELSLLRFAATTALDDAESVRDLAESLRYGVSQRETPLESEEARVMSLHASKGLTADLVVIAGAVDGILPRIDEDAPLAVQQRQEQEQRRLAFVGITRTTSILVLSTYSQLDAATAHRLQVRRGPRYGQVFRVFASSFLDEMRPELPDAVRGEDWTY